jgi:hypothetical protein
MFVIAVTGIMATIYETLSDNYRFKKRGNEEQHKHDNKVMVKFREGLYTKRLDSAKEKIFAGMDLIVSLSPSLSWNPLEPVLYIFSSRRMNRQLKDWKYIPPPPSNLLPKNLRSL